jgi:PAS domain S-box-containing protein
MNLSSWFDAGGNSGLQVLWEDGDRVLCRGWRNGVDGERNAVLAVFPAAEHPTPGSLSRLAHEYGLKDDLDGAWAVRPLALVREGGRTMLVLDDPGGEPLDRLLGPQMGIERFLRLAVALSAALGRLHQRGLVHKDIKPTNFIVNSATGQVWLTGFGIASRVPRERQSLEPPEFIAGTLPYMAPEQTGRMNRSIDSRSDLYALGVTLYELLTGRLPFTASDAMEWVHCHIARQPVPPGDRRTDIPAPISAIILKLLAKTAEERYQTAAGVEADLGRCLAEWEARRQVDAFTLGARDTPDRLLIPEKLYGRAREMETLLAAFGRVAAGGTPELMLISGYSGIGKSSVVDELHKVLVPSQGLFASGKFDQYKRDIPYATLAQAFRSLIRPLLSKGEAELRDWCDSLREALGPNGQLIVDLVPELKILLGEQPPIPDLPPQDAQGRFQLVIRRFIGVFARPQHPLALFLDDLQWLDAATLNLLEDLLSRPDVRHLMLIGAYRDNEVDSFHLLKQKLEAIRRAGAAVHEIMLAPLSGEDLGRLLADSLRCEPKHVASLAQLVYEKTAGNPFFAIQFISTLAEEALLTFHHGDLRWSWDLDRIHAKGYTDNVVDLMVEKLSRLPLESQKALQQLACIGNSAEFALLTATYVESMQKMHDDLRAVVRAGLVHHSERAYTFTHDRVQEAAYSLIPESARGATHLRIGRLLAARTAPEDIEENIFEIVNQINRGLPLITSSDERKRVAKLNFIAGRRAKISTAYVSALAYLATGLTLLTETAWDHNYELIFDIELHAAECELLTAGMAAAEHRLSMLAGRARSVQHIASVARLRLTLYTTLDRSDLGVEVCLEYLRKGGGHWTPHPTGDEVRSEYERIWSLLGSRSIEDLFDLPLMSDPISLGALDVLTEVVTPALFTDENLLSLVICRMVNLSLEHGNSDGSCFAYVWLGMILGPHFGDYPAGYRFGKLGYDLAGKRGLHRYQARAYMSFGNLVMPWTRHVRTGRYLVQLAFDAANKIGDLTFAAYSCNNLNTNLLATGDALADVQREAENGLDFARSARFGLVIDIITAQLGLVRTLRGFTPRFGVFDDDQFNESRFEHHLQSDPRLALPECWYWIRKLQARFFAGEYLAAVDASTNARGLLWTSSSFFELAEYHFYSALSHAAVCESAPGEWPREHMDALTDHQRQLELWAKNCPENFETRAALVNAEIARIEGRDLDAMHLYELAIRSAHANGFVHNEAIANELAGRFYLGRGLERNARAHLQDARACFTLWGADGKVRQLDRCFPRLAAPEGRRSATTIGSPVQQLDVTSVVKASQAVSSEIVLPRLIERLMTIALENAGADRGLLMLPTEDEYLIQAEARAEGEKIQVALCQKPISPVACPETILRYVIRSHESVILDDGSRSDLFSEDEYLRDRPSYSILCLPLITQEKLIGMLYLENTLTSHAFTQSRIAVLEVLAAQAGISLENTRLYSDLQEREAKVRRLVDSNIIGSFIWKSEGRIVEANEAFLQIVGYSRDDLVSGRVRLSELTPFEWSSADERAMAELKATGSCKAYEKEYVRKDCSRVPVLLGGATFGSREDHGVAFVLDLTERKQVEENLRQSERRQQKAQMELAHVNRVATMGQLTASVAHEVNQPIAAAVTSAEAGLNWLTARPPDLEEIRDAFERVIKAGNQAGGVIHRIRDIVKKVPVQKATLDINETLLETIALTGGELPRHRISLQTELATDLPKMWGDRVQLQQVILNLIMNAIEALSGADEGPREVLISTNRYESDGVLVAVRDSGPGLKPESIERVFDPFYTTKPTGMGVGLSICRSIIEAHGGRLWATANTPQGAIFQFTLGQDGAA